MKRERGLFDVEEIIYVIDTSAWLNVDFRPDAEACWALIARLIRAKRIIGCRRVLGELKPRGLFDRRLAPFEELLTDGCRDTGTADLDYLRLVGRITRQFPAMSKARSTRTPADPFLVALAKIDGYTVVVDESPTHRRNRKIPAACDALGVKWMPLAQFIQAEQ